MKPMKKLLYISIAACAVLFASCEPETPEMWKSETSDYAGRFVFGLYDESGTIPYYPVSFLVENGVEVQIYNTTENVANKVWIDDLDGLFPLKAQITLSGTATSFSGTEEVPNIKGGHTLYMFTDAKPGRFDGYGAKGVDAPDSAGAIAYGYTEYTSVKVENGSIGSKDTETIGGNTSDGFTLKITLRNTGIKFISYELPEEEREDPNVVEFAWKPIPTADGLYTLDGVYADYATETYTLKGYRHTGFEEDM
ncbi:hypothetical protein AGMMS4956_05550 [Bacteroidia bacterium]|nr:hypothetical protein AGMMS4956_05550 [Bacteroidia bacterium]